MIYSNERKEFERNKRKHDFERIPHDGREAMSEVNPMNSGRFRWRFGWALGEENEDTREQDDTNYQMDVQYFAYAHPLFFDIS